MPAERAEVLAQMRLELATMLPARVQRPAVDAAPMPGQPVAGVGVDVLAVTEVEHLPFQAALSFRVRPNATNLAAEDHSDRHVVSVTTRVAESSRSGERDDGGDELDEQDSGQRPPDLHQLTVRSRQSTPQFPELGSDLIEPALHALFKAIESPIDA
jgi:hypothetical protein